MPAPELKRGWDKVDQPLSGAVLGGRHCFTAWEILTCRKGEQMLSGPQRMTAVLSLRT